MFMLPAADLLPDQRKNLPCLSALLCAGSSSPHEATPKTVSCSNPAQSKPPVWVKKKDAIPPLHSPHLSLSVILITLQTWAYTLVIWNSTCEKYSLPHIPANEISVRVSLYQRLNTSRCSSLFLSQAYSHVNTQCVFPTQTDSFYP